MQVAMIVGIVIIFAGILFNFAGDIFSVQTVTDSISLQKVFIQNAGDETFISANIKNTGTTNIIDLDVVVLTDTSTSKSGLQPFVTSVSPSPLQPGMTGSVYTKLVDTNGSSIRLPTGQDIAVTINATTIDGSQLSEPVTVRAR